MSAGTIRAELTGSDTATALGITVTAYAPVLTLCRALVAAGHDHASQLQGWRGSTLCLLVCAIGDAADLELNADGTGFRPRRTPNAAAPVRGKGSARMRQRARGKRTHKRSVRRGHLARTP